MKNKLFHEQRLVLKFEGPKHVEKPPNEPKGATGENPDGANKRIEAAEADVKATELAAIQMCESEHGCSHFTNENSTHRSYIMKSGGVPRINLHLDKVTGTYKMFAPAKGLKTEKPDDWRTVVGAEADTMPELVSKYKPIIALYLKP